MTNRHGRPLKCAVFTFILSENGQPYDRIKQPKVVSPGWDHFVFTNLPIEQVLPEDHKFTPWQQLAPIMAVTQSQPKPETKKLAVGHMIYGHTYLAQHEYDITVSIGGQIQIGCDLNELLNRFRSETRLLLMRHPERACVYAEAEACIALGKDDPARIKEHMARYRQEGHPPSWGLFATGIMGMNHQDLPRDERRWWWYDLTHMWWQHVRKGSCRDQLSLPYCLRKLAPPESISEIGWGEVFHPQGFILHSHEQHTSASQREAADFAQQVQQLSAADKLDEALDLIYAEGDKRLTAHDFGFLNNLLALAPLNNIDAAVPIGFLTITASAKERLRNRRTLYESIRQRLVEEHGADRASEILSGLE